MTNEQAIRLLFQFYADYTDEQIVEKLYPEMTEPEWADPGFRQRNARIKALQRLRKGETKSARGGNLMARIHTVADETEQLREAALNAQSRAQLVGKWNEIWRAEQNKRKAGEDSSDDMLSKLPSYMKRVHERFEQGNWDAIIDILEDRLTPSEIKKIDPEHVPFILNFYGIAHQYLGHLPAALAIFQQAETSVDAIKFRSEHTNFNPFSKIRSICVSNAAGCYVRLGAYREAFEYAERARLIVEGNAPAYFNALCAASLSRNEGQFGQWSAWCRSAIHAGEFKPWALHELKQRLLADPDLKWARDLGDIWDNLIEDINSAINELK